MSATTFRFAGVKKCLWFQIAMEFHIPLSTFEKIALKFNPVYASNSLAAGKFIGQKHGLDINSVAFIPNPFDAVSVKMEQVEWREKLGVKENELMLFIAANFFPEKDHETLIKGFYIALQQNPNIKLVLAGSQANLESVNFIKSICFDLGLNSERVIFVGASNDVPGLINASDICLLTSISEGSPNALIEYMGYGKPVVTSSIPSIVELVNPDYPYLFEKGNEKDLAAKLNALILELNSENVANYTEINKQSILIDYTIEANFNAFHKILRP
jgi:glycosyltransferase involved in cell wall biosynthesis